MAGMRRLFAVAVMVAGVTLSVYAQRGGGHGAGGFSGQGGSFVSHSAPQFHASVAPMGRVNFMGSPQLSANHYAAVAHLSPGRGPGSAYPSRRPSSPDRRSGYRRPYAPSYGVGFPSGFSIWPGSLGDSGFYDDSGYANPAPPADYGPQQYAAPPVEQSETAAPTAFRPTYGKPQPPPEPENALTLVFKDGRPTEQIHNYMLTRTTLYVQDEHRREIPVDDLDLAATQKVNKGDGIDFQLPGAGR